MEVLCVCVYVFFFKKTGEGWKRGVGRFIGNACYAPTAAKTVSGKRNVCTPGDAERVG